ncbi:hypothetical protein [Burkholderia lata]|uniref:Fimbrial assembly protein n=1 Tax=Burkholderia lata (strain ATCC 17760 / DSM 23089 / LMG 22485 / NCIMB 9086 / R18194 / 383) TaxID=482957 RepID=Q39BI5_BURL3|nr:hypothetical protein [Burkholderia lata]ABB10176.1 hypothetical protein Bcep18194_B0059 [Burkholderia lata]
MNIGKWIVALGVSGALAGVAQAGTVSNQAVVKTIRLTAHIGDSLYVSRPDSPAGYGVVELEATDRTQQSFRKTVPIRVWSTNPDFIVEVAHPLTLSNGPLEMTHATVTLTSAAGTSTIAPGAAQTIAQVKQGTGAGSGGFDEVHDLKISADAPPRSSAGVNGSYRGDLVLLFEPRASAGDDKVGEE